MAHSELHFLLARLGIPYPLDPPDLLANALTIGAVALIFAGTSLPAWGSRLGLPSALRWFEQYRAYVSLAPLWRDLCRALPELPLVPPASMLLRDQLPPRELGFRLYRRLVEILDARLHLRPYMDPRVAGVVDELRPTLPPAQCQPRDIVVEAAALELALRARRSGRVSAQAAGQRPPERRQPDMDLAFFCEVARVRARSPLVRAVVARLEQTSREHVDGEAEAAVPRPAPLHSRPSQHG
jgi:hypothetical protein